MMNRNSKDQVEKLVSKYTKNLQIAREALTNPNIGVVMTVLKSTLPMIKVRYIHYRIGKLTGLLNKETPKITPYNLANSLVEMEVKNATLLMDELSWHNGFWSREDVQRADAAGGFKSNQEIKNIAASNN